MTANDSSESGIPFRRVAFAFALWTIPWLYMTLVFVFNASFMTEFFKDSRAIAMTVGLGLWETVGCLFLIKPGKWLPHLFQTLLVVLVFIMPAALIPMLGPALLVFLPQ